MYHFIEDKDFLKRMRRLCSGIVNELVQAINNDSLLEVEAHLVGSGAKNLETQNAHEPIDLDYNLNLLGVYSIDINRDAVKIKEYVRKMFNKVLRKNGWADCQDSTAALTTGRKHFSKGNQTEFSIDLAIVVEDNDGTWYRLLHNKTGMFINDRWYWNEGAHTKGFRNRVDWCKTNHHWTEVRNAYLKKKNMYLSRGDRYHPSFICYIEAVNEIYDQNN